MSTTVDGLERRTSSSDHGWWAIARRVKADMAKHNVSMIAGGAAFFGLLALFPALAAAVALYGLFTDPAAVSAHLDLVTGVMPAEARTVLDEQLQRVTTAGDRSLTIGALVALLLALWSAAKGVKSLMAALNIVYREPEQRGFFRLNVTALLLTLAMLLVVPFTLSTVAVLPALVDRLPLPDIAALAARWLRWPLLAAVAIGAIAVLYRFGPARTRPRPKWSWPGAIAATVLWLGASALFSWYVSSFGNYNETYGSVAALAVLMMWFYLSALAVLLGGELNAELEKPPRAA